VASQQPLIISDARKHPLVADNLAIRDLEVIAYAGIPLVLSDGHAVGAFCAIDTQPRDWTEQDIRILHDLSAAVRTHLELRKALAEQSVQDRLTGLANRTLLGAQAEHFLKAAGPAASGSVAAICIGLDSFSLVNQAYGAAAADRLLQQVGERLAAEARGSDMLGRLGGDTFALVGVGMGDERAVIQLAGRLRALVSAAPFDVDGHSIGISATVGLASGTAEDLGGDLLARSDDSQSAGRRPLSHPAVERHRAPRGGEAAGPQAHPSPRRRSVQPLAHPSALRRLPAGTALSSDRYRRASSSPRPSGRVTS